MIPTADMVRLAEEWESLRMGNAEHAGRRAEILRFLMSSGNPWMAGYNAARMVGYLSGLSAANVFMRMLQSECERQESK